MSLFDANEVVFHAQWHNRHPQLPGQFASNALARGPQPTVQALASALQPCTVLPLHTTVATMGHSRACHATGLAALVLLALQGFGHANNQPPPDLLAPLHITATLTWGTVCTVVANLSVVSNPAYFASVAGIILPTSSFSDAARAFAGFDTVTIRCGGCGNAVANIGYAVTVNGNALTVLARLLTASASSARWAATATTSASR